jgi:hypothetical protein
MVSGKGKRRIYSSKYALSSIVYCSICGDIYRRIAWNNRGKKKTRTISINTNASTSIK